MRIGVIGRTHLLLKTANLLVKEGHKIVFVYTCAAEPFYKATEADFEDFAKIQNCPFFNDLDIQRNIDELRRLKADVCISVNWLQILKEPLLSSFEFGILNAHAGDLPRYRGNACPNWAILNFEKNIGLTIHKMTEELDAGPFIIKDFFEITKNTYIGEIYNWLEHATPKLFLEALNLLGKKRFCRTRHKHNTAENISAKTRRRKNKLEAGNRKYISKY